MAACRAAAIKQVSICAAQAGLCAEDGPVAGMDAPASPAGQAAPAGTTAPEQQKEAQPEDPNETHEERSRRKTQRQPIVFNLGKPKE